MYYTYLRSRTFDGVKRCEPLHLYTLVFIGFTEEICHREYFPCTYSPLKTHSCAALKQVCHSTLFFSRIYINTDDAGSLKIANGLSISLLNFLCNNFFEEFIYFSLYIE